MNAVVLVGGEGTRLRPLTFTTPKPLLPIAGIPLVEWQLRWLASHGVDDVILAMGYLPDAFVEHFPGDRFEGMRLRYAVEPEPLGTAGAIRFAAEEAGIGDRFVVCNGDVLTTLDLDEFVAFHVDRGATASIHLSHVADPSAFGAVPTYADGEVEAFVEKPAVGSSPTNWINAGTYILEPDVLERIPAGAMVSIEHETFPLLLQERGRVYALGTDDYWLDVGTPQTYLEAHADVLAGRLGIPPVPDAREAAPGVWVHRDADVSSDANLEPPVLIGAGGAVATGATIARSTVGDGATVGSSAVVDGSVLHAGVRVGEGATVRSSIVGPNASVDAGANVLELTIVGAGAHVPAGATLAGGRVPVASTTG